MGSSYVVSHCSPTRYCPLSVPLFSIPAPHAYCTGAYCHVHVYRTVPLLPGDLSFDLLSPGKPSCISLCTYFAQYIHLSPVLSVELCSSLYCSQSAGAPACLVLGSSSSLDSSRNKEGNGGGTSRQVSTDLLAPIPRAQKGSESTLAPHSLRAPICLPSSPPRACWQS